MPCHVPYRSDAMRAESKEELPMYKVVDRFLIGLLTLAVIAFGGVAIAIAWNGVALHAIAQWLYVSWINPAIVTAVCVVLMLIALRVLLFGGHARPEAARVLVASGELGSVEITMDTLGQLVDTYMAGVEGVTDTKHNLRAGESGLGVYLRVAMESSVSIPTASASIQSGMKAFLERATGIAVAEVGILVDNPPAPKTRESKSAAPKPAPRSASAVAVAVPAPQNEAPADEAARS